MVDPVWVFDTSALIDVKSKVPRADRARVFLRMTTLVVEQRLAFPREVLTELRRDAEADTRDEATEWALSVESAACRLAATFDQVRDVLAVVPEILDPQKDSGVDEADPYVLALAVRLRSEGVEARVVTQEVRDYATKLSLNTACGMLGVPCVPLKGFLKIEDILTL